LQTIPSDKSKSVGKWEKRAKGGRLADLDAAYKLPNLRSMFGPDPGMTFFDMDLDRADLQVVVWEADDEMLKAALRMGADIHLLNAFVIQGKEPPPLEELVESHPKYADHRGPQKYVREFAKVFCHATNYVGSARTVAGHTGRTVHEIDRAQRIWFGAHPGIKAMHKRIETQITKYRFVENRFGYRWYIFDRVEGALPEAVAWIPQSTVSNVINRAWLNIHENAKEIEVLLQVHDSLSGQFPTDQRTECLAKLKELSRVVVPYPDPLVIPTGIKTSELSWGECA
jgi:DNA polymerase I-like protein with 3'-5' exonuclease and polymerase domains